MVTLRTYEPGQVILRENEDGECAYLIQSGRVEVTKTLGDKQIHLAFLGEGEIFGEMSMIDDKPRSATITAVERTEASEIHQDEFFHTFQTDPQVAAKVISSLFERLREADRLLLHLQKGGELPAAAPVAPALPATTGPAPTLYLQAMTSTAIRALDEPKLEIKKFPFRIGRRTGDPLVQNDLNIPDVSPWQVSRNHMAIVRQDGRIGVTDRGSKLGSSVNGMRLGGRDGQHGPIYIETKETEIWLGTPTTQWRYKLFLE